MMDTDARDYRELAAAKIVTATAIHELAAAAFSVLSCEGEISDAGEAAFAKGDRVWRYSGTTRHGPALEISCIGPDLPETIPDETIRPAEIGKTIPWLGKYRLVVKAPLIVFDLYWKPGEPLRILQFSGGDWEADVLALA